MVYDNSEMRPEMLSERDFAALKEIERSRRHKLGWFLFGIADDIAAAAVVGLTAAMGTCVGFGVAVVLVAQHRGTGVMLSAALVPIALYAAFELPPLLGVVDFTASRHKHLYPSALALGLVFTTLAWWLVLLVFLT